MVDNRSAGFFGIGGAFNFKSGDISGTAAKTQDDKMGQGGEYFQQRRRDEEEELSEKGFMDRSALLRATLNSFAMANVANVINSRKRALDDESEEQHHQDEEQQEEQEFQSVEEHIMGDEFDEFEDFDFANELD